MSVTLHHARTSAAAGPHASRPPVPVRFAAGMSGRDLLGIIFRVCRELTRLGHPDARRPPGLHPYQQGHGETRLPRHPLRRPHGRNPQGTHHATAKAAATASARTNRSTSASMRKSASAIADFAERRVADFSCDGIPHGRQRRTLRPPPHPSPPQLLRPRHHLPYPQRFHPGTRIPRHRPRHHRHPPPCRPQARRPLPRHRPHRLGQIHHPRLAHRLAPPPPSQAHRHRRGSHRIPISR